MIPPTAKTLRDYQERLVDLICGRDEDVLVEQPTGSGKTLEIVAALGLLLGSRLTHALVAAPQEQIEDGFTRRDYDTILSSTGPVPAPPIPAGPGLVRAARDGDGSVREIAAYLGTPAPGHALACTHAALTMLAEADIPADLAGAALFLDEAHHAPARGLGRAVDLWRGRGGRLLYFTATAFRADGLAVRLDGMRHVRRTLAEHMQDGDGRYAPRRLESKLVGLEPTGGRITPAMFTGEALPPGDRAGRVVEQVVTRWEGDGRPKAIVRVPPLAGGSGPVVATLIAALQARGARVLDATGSGAEHKQRFLAALRADRAAGHAESYDVVVGIQRVLEGTDWPHCSSVYCFGLPGSLPTVLQLIGRATRPKPEGYPDPYRDLARITFFVPTEGGEALGGLALEHSRHALMVCCLLADSQAGQEWLVGRAVRAGIGRALGRERAGTPESEREADEAAEGAMEPLAFEDRARIMLAIAEAYREAKARGDDAPSIGLLVRAALDDPLSRDLSRDQIVRLAMEVLVEQEGVSARVRGRIAEEVERAVAGGPGGDDPIRQAMDLAFGRVLEEFREETLSSSPLLEGLAAQIHSLTGGQIEQFARRLRDALPDPITVEQVHAEIRAFYEAVGGFPTQDSGSIERFGCSYATLDHNLRRGNRGLPGGSSVAEEVRKVRVELGLDLPDKGVLTTERVRAAIAAYKDSMGKYPTTESGDCNELGCGYGTLNNMLRKGHRGLPGGSSLRLEVEAVRRERDEVVRDRSTPLSLGLVHAAIRDHHRLHGEFPAENSGAIDSLSTTWQSLNHALRKGSRGLPSGSSVAGEVRVVAAEMGLEIPARHDTSELTIDRIHEVIWEYYREHERWPSRAMKDATQLGISFQAIDNNLRRGGRGLPAGSSISAEVARVKELRSLPEEEPVTLERIHAAIVTFQERVGTYPTVRSGHCEELDLDWKALNERLRVGFGSLPGGSSLSKEVAKVRAGRTSG